MRRLALITVGMAVAAALPWLSSSEPAPRPVVVPIVAAPDPVAAPAGPIGNLSRPYVELRAEPVVTGLDQVMAVVSPPGDPRLFLLEKVGRVRVVVDGELREEPFLDLTSVVGSEGVEQGLVGLAFHPSYAANGRFFVYFTDRQGDSRLIEYRVSPDDPNRAEQRAVAGIMAVDQPHQYHNAGMLQFGPDGMLYVAFGDGGGIGDSYGHGQRRTSVLGTISRISVDGPRPYAVPADNPFADGDGGAPALWFYGLRNPWRFWIDDGLLYLGDVGQSDWEEIDIVPLHSPGANFGWSILEGEECFEAETCDDDGMIPPVLAYPHNEGCAVIGGVVYRGTAIPGMDGHYFYGDFCGGWVRSLRFTDGAVTAHQDWSDDLAGLGQILAFGADSAGEVYVTTGDGSVYRLAGEPGTPPTGAG